MKRDCNNLHQKRRDATERLYEAFEAFNKLPVDDDDDTATAVNVELRDAERAVDAASAALEVWRDDDGPDAEGK